MTEHFSGIDGAVDTASECLARVFMALRAIDRREILSVRKILEPGVAIHALHAGVDSILEMNQVHEEARTVFGKTVRVLVAQHAIFIFPVLTGRGEGKQPQEQDGAAEEKSFLFHRRLILE
jgi:DNA-binding FadR family transcriptional regulator